MKGIMLATPHMLTGAAIGILIGSLPAVIVLAFISHFILDAIPHTEVSTFRPIEERTIDDPRVDKLTYRIAFVDISVGLIIFIVLLSLKINYSLALVGAGAAMLPDIIDNVPWWKKPIRKLPFFKQFHALHHGIHYQFQTKYWPYGFLTQVIIVAIAMWVLIRY